MLVCEVSISLRFDSNLDISFSSKLNLSQTKNKNHRAKPVDHKQPFGRGGNRSNKLKQHSLLPSRAIILLFHFSVRDKNVA